MNKQRLSILLNSIAENSDEMAFDELFRYYYPSLLSFSTSIIKDKMLAEEVVTDVFLKVWENRKVLPSIHNISQYLYISVKHTTISAMRGRSYMQQKNSVLLDDAGEYFNYNFINHDLQINTKETLNEINKAINQLPAKCRLIFKLIKEDGFKYSEVAQLLELSVKTVEKQMTIAMKRIVEILSYSLPEYKKYYKR